MNYPTLESRCLALGTVVILASWGSGPARGAEANFWIAQNNAGPQAPLIEVFGDPTIPIFVDIWARPEAGMTLGGFSLNLVSTNPGIIRFQSVDVLNPETSERNTRRHQLVFDSNTTWSYLDDGDLIDTGFDDEHLSEDFIEAFMGGTFVNNSALENNGSGIGPTCGDSECEIIDGEPAWKIATVEIQGLGVLGSTELFLEIGEHGVWHFAETSESTAILFGDPADGDPEDRHTWATIDTGGHSGLPDAILSVVLQPSDADFDDDGRVDGTDFRIWQRGLNGGTTHAEGDANLDGMVNDYDLQIWETQYGSTVIGPITSVPEPTTLVVLTTFLTLARVHMNRSR